jgi:hypothetical protein
MLMLLDQGQRSADADRDDGFLVSAELGSDVDRAVEEIGNFCVLGGKCLPS